MAHLVEAVLYLARRDDGLGQVEMGEKLRMPQSAVSKFERGQTTLAVHHLDRIAEALGEGQGDDAREWEGWQLYRRATTLADLLATRGYEVWWIGAEPPDGVTILRGRRLAEKLRRLWARAERSEWEEDCDAAEDDRWEGEDDEDEDVNDGGEDEEADDEDS